MNKAILISRPDHDLINTYFFHWCKDVIDEARRHNVKPLDLAGNKATKSNLISYIKKQKPVLIFLNGHGNKDCIAGYNDEILLESKDKDNLLAESIVYIRSCEVGAGFGKECINKNTIAFIGYTRKYTLCMSRASQAHPRSDRVAQLFLIPSNLIPISLIKGNKVKDAYRKSQNAMIRSLGFMLSTKATQEQKDSLPYLWSNKKYQILLGDGNAHI